MCGGLQAETCFDEPEREVKDSQAVGVDDGVTVCTPVAVVGVVTPRAVVGSAAVQGSCHVLGECSYVCHCVLLLSDFVLFFLSPFGLHFLIGVSAGKFGDFLKKTESFFQLGVRSFFRVESEEWRVEISNLLPVFG
jgi:hypothetical protein